MNKNTSVVSTDVFFCLIVIITKKKKERLLFVSKMYIIELYLSFLFHRAYFL